MEFGQENTIGLSQEDAQMFDRAYQVLNKMRDTFVNASSLAKEVEELRSAVFALRADVESYRQSNAELDGALSRVRQERDEAREQVVAVQRELGEVKTERDGLRISLETKSGTLTELEREVAIAKSARESAELDTMYAIDRVKELTQIVGNMRSAMGMPPLPIWELPKRGSEAKTDPVIGNWPQGSQGQF